MANTLRTNRSKSSQFTFSLTRAEMPTMCDLKSYVVAANGANVDNRRTGNRPKMTLGGAKFTANNLRDESIMQCYRAKEEEAQQSFRDMAAAGTGGQTNLVSIQCRLASANEHVPVADPRNPSNIILIRVTPASFRKRYRELTTPPKPSKIHPKTLIGKFSVETVKRVKVQHQANQETRIENLNNEVVTLNKENATLTLRNSRLTVQMEVATASLLLPRNNLPPLQNPYLHIMKVTIYIKQKLPDFVIISKDQDLLELGTHNSMPVNPESVYTDDTHTVRVQNDRPFSDDDLDWNGVSLATALVNGKSIVVWPVFDGYDSFLVKIYMTDQTRAIPEEKKPKPANLSTVNDIISHIGFQSQRVSTMRSRTELLSVAMAGK